MRLSAFLIAFAAAAVSGAALADPPTVVGRLSLVEGAASIRHNYDQQWAPAGVNYPVIMGDAVWSDQQSRTALEVGAADARLDQASELDIDRLDDSAVALRLQQGVVNLMVRYVPPGGIQLLTSVGQLAIHRPGEYHIDAGRPDNPTQLLLGVLSGEATFSGMRGVVELRSGQGAMVPPDQTGLQVVTIYPTDFDRWVESQEAAPVASAATYPDSDIPGYSDLGYYGTWEEDPDYGQVWYPSSIEVGWAPYRQGHWDYVWPWGWTWIDNAPWGWAPFHYGRWAQFNGRWGWIPGNPHEHHYYAPALVAFVGGTPGEHMGAGIGWVPLGPHEVFHPYYAHSDTYVLNINRPHFHDEHEFREHEAHWRDRDANMDRFRNHGAVTNVSTTTFTGGQPVHQNLQQPGPNHAGPGPVMHDFDRLPQPEPHPVQAGPAAPPQFHGPQQPQAQAPQQQQPYLRQLRQEELRPQQQQQQPQPRPQQPAAPQPAPQPPQPQYHPQPMPQPAQQQQPQYHPQPQPQPAQQPRPQPQQQREAPPHPQEKDPKRDRR